MARKPCAQDVLQLEDICDISCNNHGARRFRRIARNAVMPFYYDCNKCSKLTNSSEKDSNGCVKIFYIKNPAFYSGTYNDSTNVVTQKSVYSYLANLKSRTPQGRKNTQQLDFPSSCSKNKIFDFFFNTKNITNLPINYAPLKSYSDIKRENLFQPGFENNFLSCNCSDKVQHLKN